MFAAALSVGVIMPASGSMYADHLSTSSTLRESEVGEHEVRAISCESQRFLAVWRCGSAFGICRGV